MNDREVACSSPAAIVARRSRKRRYSSAGSARTHSSAATVAGTRSAASNDENSESRSSAAPLVTKNTGMNTPKPTPSSFGCRPELATALLRSRRLTIAPAMNAPSTTSRPNSWAISTSPARSRKAIRTPICALVSCRRRTVAVRRSDPRAPASRRPIKATSAPNSSSRTTVLSALEPWCEKNSERRITVAKSAIEAAVMTSWPNGLSVRCASFSTATTIPNDVAASTMATSSGASTNSTASNPSATATASTSEARKAMPTSPRWRSRRASKVISRPARKNRNTSPTSANTSSGADSRTRSSTCGPISTPAMISATIGGIAGSGERSRTTGASVAAAMTMTRSV